MNLSCVILTVMMHATFALRGKVVSDQFINSGPIVDSTEVLQQEIELHEKLAYWDITYVTTQIIFAIMSCSLFAMLTVIGRSKDLIRFFYVSVAVFSGFALSLCISVFGHFPATYGALFIGFFTAVWGANAAFEKFGAIVKMARVLGLLCIFVLITSLLNLYVPKYNSFWLLLPARWFSFIGIHLLVSILFVVGLPRIFGQTSSSVDSSPFLRDFFAIISITGLGFASMTQLSLLFYATGLVDDSPLDIVAFFSAKPTISLTNPVHLAYLIGWIVLVSVGVAVDHRRAQLELTVVEEMDEDANLMHEDISIYDTYDYNAHQSSILEKKQMQQNNSYNHTNQNPYVQSNDFPSGYNPKAYPTPFDPEFPIRQAHVSAEGKKFSHNVHHINDAFPTLPNPLYAPASQSVNPPNDFISSDMKERDVNKDD